MNDRTERLLRLILNRVPLTLAALLLFVAVAINFANVIGRYVFLAPVYWADEAMVFLVIWSILLASVAVTYENGHLTMDLFSTRLSPGGRRALDATIAVACLAVFAFMAWQSRIVIVAMMKNDQRSYALELPMAVPHAALLVGFILSALVVAARLVLGRRMSKPATPDDIITPAV